MVSTAAALGVTVLTLAVVTGLGVWYSRGRITSVEDFITARNTTGGGMTTATLIASGMGAWILLSPAEAGAVFGGLSAVIGYGIGSALPMLVYVWLGPRIRTLIPDGHNLAEYALARYGRSMYAYGLLISVAYMFIFLSAEMTGIASALSILAGVPAWQTATLIGGFVLVYTAYGGLVGSIFTDTVQTLVILPILAVGFAGALLSLGGPETIYAEVVAQNPQLVSLGFLPGLKFGVYVAVAILGAEMMNQAWWQRIYAARDTGTLRRSFAITALAVVPMILLAGLFGLVATGLDSLVTSGAEYNADVALFLVVNSAFSEPITLAIVLLAILLVMSTADTLFNAISSLFTPVLQPLLENPGGGGLTAGARALTIVVAAGAIFIGARGYSVLQLFFVADLLATATFFPFLYGLYSERVTEGGALVASLLGLAVGGLYFPTFRGFLSGVPGIGPLLPGTGLTVNDLYLFSFGGAFLVSALLSVLLARVSESRFDLDSLAHEIRAVGESVGPDRPEADD